VKNGVSPRDPGAVRATDGASVLSAAYCGKTVAVTGARGYIGRELAAAVGHCGARLVLVSRRAQASTAGAGSITANLHNPRCWQEIVAQADVIFHLAGNTSVSAAAADPAASFRSTALPIAHLGTAARDLRRMPRVVFASTATVYGMTERLPVAEDRPPNPVTVYDLHKWFAEQQLTLASRQGLVEAVSLRLPNVYGPSAGLSANESRGVINAVARRALSGDDVLLYGDGRYVRDYVDIEDVVRAFLVAGSQPGLSGEVFNVASGQGVTIRDAFHLVVERAARATGRRSRIGVVPWPLDADPIELRNFVADISRIAAACGWTPQVSLVDGIDRLIDALNNRRAAEG
jgi:nucleoside-diphosphate-sugar epimerase